LIGCGNQIWEALLELALGVLLIGRAGNADLEEPLPQIAPAMPNCLQATGDTHVETIANDAAGGPVFPEASVDVDAISILIEDRGAKRQSYGTGVNFNISSVAKKVEPGRRQANLRPVHDSKLAGRSAGGPTEEKHCPGAAIRPAELS